MAYTSFPRLIDSEVRARGLVRRSALSRSTGRAAPVIGTAPSGGAMGRSYGAILRWWRMVENQLIRCTASSGLHPAGRTAARRAAAAGHLATPHLLRAARFEQALDARRPVGPRRDEHAELVVGEARIPRDGPAASRGE